MKKANILSCEGCKNDLVLKCSLLTQIQCVIIDYEDILFSFGFVIVCNYLSSSSKKERFLNAYFRRNKQNEKMDL